MVPVYNGEKYIAAAIESVFAQSFSDWELIVVDDCSQDSTWEILQQYADVDRVRLFKNEKNLGQFPTHNRGAELAEGRYIKFLHADDLLYPHCLEIMVSLMDAFPDAAMGISSNPSTCSAPSLLQPKQVWSQYLLRQSSLMSEGPIRSIFRTGVFKSLDGFDVRFDSSDVKINLTVAMTHPILILPEGLTWYRIHDDQISVIMREGDIGEKEKYLWVKELIFSENFPLPGLQKRQALERLNWEYLLLCRHHLLKGRIRRALSLLKAVHLSLFKLFKREKVDPISTQELEATAIVENLKCGDFPISGKMGYKIESTPKVSFILPAGTNIGEVETIVGNLTGQSYSCWELIVHISDMSEPNLRSNEIFKKDGRIRPIHDQRPMDYWHSYNQSVASANGEYIVFPSEEFALFPYSLEIMVGMMEHYPEAGLGTMRTAAHYLPGVCISPKQAWQAEFFSAPRFLGSLSELIIRRKHFKSHGGFESGYEPQSRFLQLKLSSTAPIVLLGNGLIQSQTCEFSPNFAIGNKSIGWSDGYRWIADLLASDISPLSTTERQIAFAKLLFFELRQSENSVKERLQILRLIKQNGLFKTYSAYKKNPLKTQEIKNLEKEVRDNCQLPWNQRALVNLRSKQANKPQLKKNLKKMFRKIVRKVANFSYCLITYRMDKSDNITRFYMYKHLAKYSESRSGDMCVLSISNSQRLARLLGFSDDQITNVSYPEHSIFDLPFDDLAFDAVVSDQVFEHISGDPYLAMREVFRVLRPKGISLHTTCFINPIHGAPKDYWRFTPNALSLLTEEYGENLDVGGWGNPYVWIFVAFGLRSEPIPLAEWHPINQLATQNHPDWPIVTWVLTKKSTED